MLLEVKLRTKKFKTVGFSFSWGRHYQYASRKFWPTFYRGTQCGNILIWGWFNFYLGAW